MSWKPSAAAMAQRTCSYRWATPAGRRASSKAELAQNAWLTVEADAGVLFDVPPEQRLPAAMQLLGIDFARLSEGAGHA